MLSVYPACFFKDETGFSVVFPDLNWPATSGSTETEALNMAVDCLVGYLYVLRQDGEEAPAALTMDDVSLDAVARELDADATGAFVNMVSVDVDEYAKRHFGKPVRKTVTIPAWLNTAAQEKSLNFFADLTRCAVVKNSDIRSDILIYG